MQKFDEISAHRCSGDTKPHWPSNVRSISLDELDTIGAGFIGTVSPSKSLDGVELTIAQTIGAVLTVGAAVVVAVVEALRFFGYGVR